MNFKIFPSGRCTLAYVRGLTYRRAEPDPRRPVKLWGDDPDQVQTLIDSLAFQNRFTSWAINYAREDVAAGLTDDQIRADVQSYLAALLPGQTPGMDYLCSVFLHREYPKDPTTKLPVLTAEPRITAHGIVPNYLLTAGEGRKLQPYYDRQDRGRMVGWQELTNHDRGYVSPLAPDRSRKPEDLVGQRDNQLPEPVKDIKAALHARMLAAVAAGKVTNEATGIAWLKKEGWAISRRTGKSISITKPGQKRPIRLEGVLYGQAGFERAAAAKGRSAAVPTPKAPTRDWAALRVEYASRVEARRVQLAAQVASAERSAARKREIEAREHPETAQPLPATATADEIYAEITTSKPTAEPTKTNHAQESEPKPGNTTVPAQPVAFADGSGFARQLADLERGARAAARRIGDLVSLVHSDEIGGWEISREGVEGLAGIRRQVDGTNERFGGPATRIRIALRNLTRTISGGAKRFADRGRSLWSDVSQLPSIVISGAGIKRCVERLKARKAAKFKAQLDQIEARLRARQPTQPTPTPIATPPVSPPTPDYTYYLPDPTTPPPPPNKRGIRLPGI